MKNKIMLFATAFGVLNISPAWTLSSGELVECIECRYVTYPVVGEPVYGECQRYGEGCCDPCRKMSIVDPVDICTEQNCSGETVWDGDTCTQTDTKGCADSTTCATTEKTSCKAGYYGESPQLFKRLPTSTCSGCTECPSSADGLPTTSTPGDNDTITKCFIPSGAAFSDSTGNGTYTENCYYNE